MRSICNVIDDRRHLWILTPGLTYTYNCLFHSRDANIHRDYFAGLLKILNGFERKFQKYAIKIRIKFILERKLLTENIANGCVSSFTLPFPK